MMCPLLNKNTLLSGEDSSGHLNRFFPTIPLIAKNLKFVLLLGKRMLN